MSIVLQLQRKPSTIIYHCQASSDPNRSMSEDSPTNPGLSAPFAHHNHQGNPIHIPKCTTKSTHLYSKYLSSAKTPELCRQSDPLRSMDLHLRIPPIHGSFPMDLHPWISSIHGCSPMDPPIHGSSYPWIFLSIDLPIHGFSPMDPPIYGSSSMDRTGAEIYSDIGSMMYSTLYSTQLLHRLTRGTK